METQLQTNIFNAIRTLFNSLPYPNKKHLLETLSKDLNAKKTDNQALIEARNNPNSYTFSVEEFEKISEKMLNEEKIDFEPYKTNR